MEDGTAKLADFGLSELCEGENDQLESTEGTYFFMAPELFKLKKGIEGKPLDIWALGVSFYAFLYLKVEFGKGRVISEDLKRILLLMMEKDPQKRIKIE